MLLGFDDLLSAGLTYVLESFQNIQIIPNDTGIGQKDLSMEDYMQCYK